MITFLKGRVEHLEADHVALDVNGVGYEIFASSRTLAKLQVREATKLLIHTHVREDAFILFGFADIAEKRMFKMLTDISGVGPKVGLSLLSTLTPAEMGQAVATGSGKTFARANGVGPKLGERIALELKGKLGALPTLAGLEGEVTTTPVQGVPADVFSALINLGYKEQAAQKALAKTLPGLTQSGTDVAFDALLKATLKELR